MKTSWRFLLLALALALLLVVVLLNQALIFAYLIEPVARILWLIYRTFLAVDQGVYWTLLVLAAAAVVLRLLAGRREPSYRPAYLEPARREDRVADWEALLRSAEENASARRSLQQELENLSRSIEALAEGSRQPEISLPPIQKGIRARLPILWKSRFLSRILPQRTRRPPSAFERRVDILLCSMETQLEINHDRPTRPAGDE